MRKWILTFIDAVAKGVGLPEKRLMTKSSTDNLTLKQPRLEYEFLAEKMKKSGKVLGITRKDNMQTTKRELYTVNQDIKLQLFCTKEAWRATFCHDFLKLIPICANDALGNYVKISPGQFEAIDKPEKRIGDKVIAAFNSYDAIITLTFQYRITNEKTEQLIKIINIINPVINSAGKKE